MLLLGTTIAAVRPGWVIRWPRTVLSLLFAPSLAAALVLLRPNPPGIRLEIDPSTESLLPAGDVAFEAYERAVVDYGDDQIFVIAMETDDVFTAENLRAMRRVSDRISRLRGVRLVTSLVNVTSFRYVAQKGWIEVRPFIEEIPADPVELAALRARALKNPVYRKTLVSLDGRTAALNVSFREMTDGEFIGGDFDGRIERILDAETTESRAFHVSGRPHIKSVMYHSMTRDLSLLIPVALAVIAVVLALFVGTSRGLILPLATVAMAVLWTFGSIALLERPLTVLTVLLAPTLVAIGSVYGVHVVGRYEEEVARGSEPGEMALRCLRHMVVPVLIAGLTTAAGYAALLITDVPAVFEIGAFSVLGIASITLISLTGIPAALTLFPLHEPRPEGRNTWFFAVSARLSSALDHALARLAAAIPRRSSRILLAWTASSAVAIAFIPRIQIDTDYLSFFDEESEVRREFATINRLLAGAVPLYVVLETNRAGYLRGPDALRAIEAVQRRIDEIPGVSCTLSFIDHLRVMNRALAEDDPSEERIPDSRGSVAELLFMLPKGDLQRFATIDQSNANIIVRTGKVGSAAMRELTERIRGVLVSGELPSDVVANVTGNAVLLARAADGVAQGQPRTVGLAALSIFGLLALGLRSLRFGLVAMIPNLVPVLIYFGVLGAGLAPLSLPTSLIGSVALGIAIDATAHYLVRYRAERRRGAAPEDAVLRCGRLVGRPVAIASLMLVLGFLSLSFSEFTTLRAFGYLSALTMAICGLCDLILLPAILVTTRL